MLKEGYDHFEVIRQPPKVDVCGRAMSSMPLPAERRAVQPDGACPPMSRARCRSASRVAGSGEAREHAEFIEIAARLDGKRERQQAAAMVAAVPAAEPAAADATAGDAARHVGRGGAAVARAATTASLPRLRRLEPAAPTSTVPLRAACRSPPRQLRADRRQPPVEATAYVQEPEKRGFFCRVISAVNPF